MGRKFKKKRPIQLKDSNNSNNIVNCEKDCICLTCEYAINAKYVPGVAFCKFKYMVVEDVEECDNYSKIREVDDTECVEQDSIDDNDDDNSV